MIRHEGPWQGLDDVEYVTLEYGDWFNQQWLYRERGMIPLTEFETAYFQRPAVLPLAASQ